MKNLLILILAILAKGILEKSLRMLMRKTYGNFTMIMILYMNMDYGGR